MRDVALALYASGQYGQRLNRIRLQKFVYLTDIASVLSSLASKRIQHKTYLYGPYDPDIQTAANCLTFRGIATAINVVRASRNRVYSEFSLTKSGEAWVESFNDGLENALAINLAVAQQVEHLGWHRLRALVYAEPTFVSTKRRGYGQDLDVERMETNTSARLLSHISQVVNVDLDMPASLDSLLEIYFRYLDRYSSLVNDTHQDSLAED